MNTSKYAEIHYMPQPTKEELSEDARKLSELLSAQKEAGVHTINPSLHAGTHRVDILDGRATYTVNNSVIESTASVNRGGGILASATDSAGFPVVNLTDQTMVDVGGMRTTIETAVLLGYLVKHGPGQYAEPGAPAGNVNAPRTSSAPTGNAPQSSKDDFSDFEEMDRQAEAELEALRKDHTFVEAETEAVVEGVYRQLGAGGAENLVNRYLGAMNAGNDGAMEQLTVEYGGQLGVDPGVLKGQMGGILEKFTAQGARYMRRAHGIDGRDAIEWARENLAPESIMRLAQMQFFKGDLRGYDELATAYKWAKKAKLS
jgi:hypothetical protein